MHRSWPINIGLNLLQLSTSIFTWCQKHLLYLVYRSDFFHQSLWFAASSDVSTNERQDCNKSTNERSEMDFNRPTLCLVLMSLRLVEQLLLRAAGLQLAHVAVARLVALVRHLRARVTNQQRIPEKI